jgi:hypothetical protein
VQTLVERAGVGRLGRVGIHFAGLQAMIGTAGKNECWDPDMTAVRRGAPPPSGGISNPIMILRALSVTANRARSFTER